MRVAIFLLTCLAVRGYAEEVQGEITREEWDELLVEIQGRTATTISKIRALQSAAQNAVIVDTGKVLDIEPGAKAGDLLVTVVHLTNGSELAVFPVLKKDAPVVATWKKWDRVSWRSTASVDRFGRVEEKIIYHGPKSLQRGDSPGPTTAKWIQARRSYASWRRFFNYYRRIGAWSRALRLLKEQRDKAAPIDGVVVRQTETGIVVKFRSGLESEVVIDDPEVRLPIKRGMKVTVAVFVRSSIRTEKELKNASNAVRVELEFWRVKVRKAGGGNTMTPWR